MEVFTKMQFAFIGTMTLAFIVWEAQDFIASFAASRMVTVTKLRTTEERDDARMLRAFHQAKDTLHVDATLVTESNPQQQTRDAELTVMGAKKRETLEGRKEMVAAMQAAFKREGPGELYDVGHAPQATPVQTEALVMMKRLCQGMAAVILVLGLVHLVSRWGHSGLPRGALFGILATAITLLLVGLGHEGASLTFVLLGVLLPGAFLGLIIYLTLRVRRARLWTEGQARITLAKVETEHYTMGNESRVKNKARVEYEFSTGSQTVRGNTISIGIQPADKVHEVVERYAVGSKVPVFYDPKHPEDNVLERNPPVSLGCIWTGALTLLAGYTAFVAWWTTGLTLPETLDKAAPALASIMPGVHHPLGVLCSAGFGLFCLAAGVWNRLHPRTIPGWVQTTGCIVASRTEKYEEHDSDSSSGYHTFYRPVVEFSYTVADQEYRGLKGAHALVEVTGRSQSGSDAEVEKYPVGKEVDVFHDPGDPTISDLTPREAVQVTGTSPLIVGTLMIALAVYLSVH